jgi:pimeloyl-ACP methyl ester carboxylesterase
MTETSLLQAGGQSARVLDTGQGDPVVVLHGWGGRIESMHPVIECLAGAFRVLAIDLPGFGESPAPAGAWGTPDYAAFVRDLLAGMGIDRARFLGHSFGAKISLYLSAVHPDLVEKVVLSGSPGLKIAPSAQARMKKAVARSARVAGRLGPPGRKLKQAVYDRIASTDYKEAGPLQPILVKVVNEDLTHLLQRVKASTLLVWGSEDTAVPLAAAQRMEQLIGDAGLVVFEGAGHFAYLDEPQRFCRVVRHFFGSPLA